MKQKKAHASHPVGNRTVIGIICIVVALAICFGIAPLVNRLSDGKTKIVRLILDISAGATITEADIEVADVGSYNLPTGVIKDKAQVVGKCALSNLTKGDYLFPSKIGNDTNNAGRMLESLDEKIEETTIAGKKVFNVEGNYLIACFDDNVTDEVITAIAKQEPYYFVMRDSSMANDSVATNFDQVFATYSPTTIRKVL